MGLRLLLALLFFVPAWTYARTFDPILLQPGMNSIHAIKQLYSLDNTKRQWTAEQVFSGVADDRFVQNKEYILFLGVKNSHKTGDYWVRADVHNEWTQDAIAVFDYGTTPSVSRVFLFRGQDLEPAKVIDFGQHLKWTKRHISIPPGHWRMYLEITPDDFSLPLIILDFKTVEALTQNAGELHFLSISYGICLALMAYNFMLALMLRKRVNLIYVFYISALLLYYEGRYQLLAEQFNVPEIPKWALLPVNASTTFLFVIFLYEILNVEVNLPKWKWPLRIMIGIWPILVAYSFYDRTGAQIALLLILVLSGPIAISLGLHAVFRRVPFSVPLLISTALPGLGSSIHFLPQVFEPFIPMPFITSAQLIAMDFEMILLSLTVGAKFNREQESLKKKVEHAYSELKTIVYPHQLNQIWDGESLGQTMPIGVKDAYIIAFDVVASSKMQIANPRAFLSAVMRDCSLLMMERYTTEGLKANAYRIKEMGDGFLCSVGFPFACPGDNPAEHSLMLAREFVKIFENHVKSSGSQHDLHCAIGIALGPVEAYYPESGAQVYDLFGKGIILAHRYESMRDVLFRWLGRKDSIIVLQQEVFNQLSPESQLTLSKVDLSRVDFKVRDDEGATVLYYHFSKAVPDLSVSA